MRNELKPTNENIAKLPKWAQSHIAILVMRLAEARKRIAETNVVVDAKCTSGIILSPYAQYPVALKNDRIRFWIEPDKFAIDVNVSKGFNGGADDLYLTGYGHSKSSRLSVRPSASNALYIGPAND
jgi:hypothetical protein